MGRHKVVRGPYLFISQVMLMTTCKFLRCMHPTRQNNLSKNEEVVTSETRWIGVRGEDAGDLKRSELNELVENLTCLNALERKIWTSNQKIVTDEKSWKTWKSKQNVVKDEELVQNIVMNEELIPNGVMDEKFVKNFVMDAKIDPKVVMDLSIFKIGGWNILQPINQHLLEEFSDENEPRLLLIGIPSKDLFLRIQRMEQHFVRTDLNVKELMPLREGLR